MPSNEYYDSSGVPSTNSAARSFILRDEFSAIERGFLKFPQMNNRDGYILQVDSGQEKINSVEPTLCADNAGIERTAHRNISGGHVGKSGGIIQLKNLLGTITSLFGSNNNAAPRTYTFQDRDGTLVDDTDMTLKANLASPTLTGIPLAPTPSYNDNSTRIATTASAKAIFVQTYSTVYRHPKGFTIMRGTFETVNNPSYVAVVFPEAFTSIFGVFCSPTEDPTGSAGWPFEFYNKTVSGFRCWSPLAPSGQGGGITFNYIAIGYKAP